MKELNFFIYALNEVLGDNIRLVAMYQKLPAVVKAYKIHAISVYEWRTGGKTLVCKAEETARSITEEENRGVERRLANQAIKEVLRYYGVGVQ